MKPGFYRLFTAHHITQGLDSRSETVIESGNPEIRAAARTHAIGLEVSEHFLDRQGGWSVRSAADTYNREDPEKLRKWVTFLALD